jgi:hypothetical protein
MLAGLEIKLPFANSIEPNISRLYLYVPSLKYQHRFRFLDVNIYNTLKFDLV